MIKIDTGEVEQKCAWLFWLKQVIGTICSEQTIHFSNLKKNEEAFVREILYESIEYIKFYLNFKSQKASKMIFQFFFIFFWQKSVKIHGFSSYDYKISRIMPTSVLPLFDPVWPVLAKSGLKCRAKI